MAGCNSCYNPAKKCHSACDPVFTKVDVLPEPYLATHGHAYITPDDKVYVLDHEGVEFVLLNSVGGTTKAKNIRDVTPTEGGYSINYTDDTNDTIRIPKQITYDIQGDYLVASNGAEYRLPKTEDTNTTYTIEGNELVGSDGTRVPLPRDNDTTYTIEGLELVGSDGSRQEIPQPEPIFFGDGLLISDDNIVTLDPAFLPPDNYVQDVKVSRTGNVVKLTYTFVDKTAKEVEFTDNDTVALAYDDTELRNLIQGIKDVIRRLETKEDKDTIYDDSDIKRHLSFTDLQIDNLREIVNRLEARREAPEIRAGEGISVNEGTISVNPDFPLFRVDPASPPSSLNDMARKVLALLKRVDKDTIYNDSEIKTQLGLLRTELANLRNTTRNYDDTQIRNLINNLQTSVTALQQRRDNDTIYNDTELRNLIAGLRTSVTELQQRRDNDTIYNDTELRGRVVALERKTDANTKYRLVISSTVNNAYTGRKIQDWTPVTVSERIATTNTYGIRELVPTDNFKRGYTMTRITFELPSGETNVHYLIAQWGNSEAANGEGYAKTMVPFGYLEFVGRQESNGLMFNINATFHKLNADGTRDPNVFMTVPLHMDNMASKSPFGVDWGGGIVDRVVIKEVFMSVREVNYRLEEVNG